jgi:hypothetical protein
LIAPLRCGALFGVPHPADAGSSRLLVLFLAVRTSPLVETKVFSSARALEKAFV